MICRKFIYPCFMRIVIRMYHEKKVSKSWLQRSLKAVYQKVANNASKTLNIYINIFNVLIVIDE